MKYYSPALLSLSFTHATASRAYPHGCLYRHPSYYTYDEREDISWSEGQFFSDVEQDEKEHSDFRHLPPPSSKLRRSYERYRLTRRLGAGKFSEVYEAVDLEYAQSEPRKMRVGRSYHGEITDCTTETEEDETDVNSLVVLKVRLAGRLFEYSSLILFLMSSYKCIFQYNQSASNQYLNAK